MVAERKWDESGICADCGGDRNSVLHSMCVAAPIRTTRSPNHDAHDAIVSAWPYAYAARRRLGILTPICTGDWPEPCREAWPVSRFAWCESCKGAN